jgi:SAM-dependent methyltransferase
MTTTTEQQRRHYDIEYGKKEQIRPLGFPSPSGFFHNYKYDRLVYELVRDELMSRPWTEAAPPSVLEVGVGSGDRLLRYCYQITKPAFVPLGVDISPVAIQRARTEFRRRGFPFEDIVVADALKLPHEHASIDLAISIEVLEHLEDPRRAIAEMFRVLRPGGSAVIGTPNKSYFFKRLLARAPGLYRRFASPTPQGDVGDSDWRHLHPSEMTCRELRTELLAAGFEIEAVRGTNLISQKSYLDRHLWLFGLSVLADAIFDALHLYPHFQWSMLFKVRKPHPNGRIRRPAAALDPAITGSRRP